MTLAAHFTFVLGAHIAPENSSDESPKSRHGRHLRNLFWICYTLDKEFSLRTGNPSTICDTNCDLTITPNYMQQLYIDLAPCLSNDECYPCVIFPSDARLSCVKSSIYQLLYSASSVYKSDIQLLVDVRKLDEDLEAWRQAVPVKYRPGPSAQDAKNGKSSETDVRVLLIRLEYECSLALIHKATSRCMVGTTSEIEKLPGLSSSRALAVQASRSSLTYLQGACHSLAETNFWLAFPIPFPSRYHLVDSVVTTRIIRLTFSGLFFSIPYQLSPRYFAISCRTLRIFRLNGTWHYYRPSLRSHTLFNLAI
jgi:hypothetical protein